MTVSRSGHRVAPIRRRSATSGSSGMLTRKGRIAPLAAAGAMCAGSRLDAAAAAEAMRTLRRVGDDHSANMLILLWGKQRRTRSSARHRGDLLIRNVGFRDTSQI